MAKYKIMWQSSTPMGAHPVLKEYADAVVENSKNILSSNFELIVKGVSKGTFELNYTYNDGLNNREIMENYISAEDDGYAAVAVGCFIDPCMHEAREILEIPIASLGEVSMHYACFYGAKFGIVTPGPLLKEKFYGPLVRKYGLEYRCVGMQHLDIPFEVQVKAFSDPEEHISEFMKVSKTLIEKGADVIISGCGMCNAMLTQNKVSQIEDTGVPFVDGSSALMKTIESMILMKENLGTKVSRKGYYASPANFHETRKIYGLE